MISTNTHPCKTFPNLSIFLPMQEVGAAPLHSRLVFWALSWQVSVTSLDGTNPALRQ